MEAGEFVWALIEQADSRLLEAELARLLRADLADPLPGARARRRAYLWLLHDLIEQTGERFPQRLLYDRERAGMKAPTSRTIVNQYGTWWEACAIASRMEDGGRLPRGRSYSGGRLRGRFAPEMYTVEEGIASVRLCAFTIGRRPSSGEYDAWQLRQVRIARERNVERRVPSRCALARLFPGKRRWERALAAAAITDAELQAARAAFPHRPHDSDENPFLHLPVREASILAVELKGSLDWLAGRTRPHPRSGCADELQRRAVPGGAGAVSRLHPHGSPRPRGSPWARRGAAHQQRRRRSGSSLRWRRCSEWPLSTYVSRRDASRPMRSFGEPARTQPRPVRSRCRA